MRAAVVLTVAIGIAGPVSAARAQAPVAAAQQAPLTLAELEQLALESNPTAVAAQAAIDAAGGRVRQAGLWPNPVIGYTAEEIPLGDRGEPRGSQGFFVEQSIVLGGKLRLSQAVFERAREEAEARAELQRQRIISSVRTLFYQVLTEQRRIEVHERLAALGIDATGVTAQLFNVGAADQPDFLESEIETRRIQLELNAARNHVAALRQQLAAVAGRVDVATRPLAGSIDVAIPELERDMILETVIERSPQVRAARAALARTQAVTNRERREPFPNVFIRGGVVNNRERAEVTAEPIGWEGQIEAGLSVPLFNRNQGAIAAARADEVRAQAELTRVQLSLRARAAGEFAKYLTALRSAESFRTDILPRAERAYTLYLARYREMGAAYPQVLISQRTLFEMTREYLEHLEMGWRSALRLQGLLAGDGLEAPSVEGAGGGEGMLSTSTPDE
jgi:cobalt-zinc-cadmium efflux system outer membrane protein